MKPPKFVAGSPVPETINQPCPSPDSSSKFPQSTALPKNCPVNAAVCTPSIHSSAPALSSVLRTIAYCAPMVSPVQLTDALTTTGAPLSGVTCTSSIQLLGKPPLVSYKLMIKSTSDQLLIFTWTLVMV